MSEAQSNPPPHKTDLICCVMYPRSSVRERDNTNVSVIVTVEAAVNEGIKTTIAMFVISRLLMSLCTSSAAIGWSRRKVVRARYTQL